MRRALPISVTNYLILLLSLLVLTACAKPDVLADKLDKRNGIIYQVDSDEPFTGRSMRFYENGQLENTTDYKDGKKDGLSVWFWENGNMGQRANLKEGKKNGLLEAFNKNGELIRSVIYKNGAKVD
jgi:antitoxin component YwqK of YwqJK toxin-antitoxin module